MIKSIQAVYIAGSSNINEDSLLLPSDIQRAVVDPDYNPITLGLSDGGTGLFGENDFNGRTGGQMASSAVVMALRNGTGSLRDLTLDANHIIQSYMANYEVPYLENKLSRWVATAAFVRLDKDRGEIKYTQIGDSPILARYSGMQLEPVAGYVEQDRHLMIAWKKLVDEKRKAGENLTRDSIFKILKPDFQRNRRNRMNREFGGLNGEREAENFILTGTIPTDGLESLIIITDGMLIPKENPEAPENWKEFDEIYRNHGLSGVANHIIALEKSDPECLELIRYKTSDDKTGIAVDFV